MNMSTRRNWMKRTAAAGLGLGWVRPEVAQAAAPHKLKITRSEAFGLRIPFNERVRENMLENYRRENIERIYMPWIMKIYTDAGLIGLGESEFDPRTQLQAMQGHDVWEFVNDQTVGPGIMIAIYDLVAQAAGIPVCKLFSPEPRKLIQHTWWSHSLRPALLREETKRGMELGYRVHKIKARPYEDPIEQVAAMAEVAPHDYEIYIDANGSFVSAGRALAVADGLRRYSQFKGFEEPITNEDLVGYREIRKHLPFRLAVHYESVDHRSFMLESLNDAFVDEDFRWGPALAEKAELCQLTGQRLWVENGLYSGISQVFEAHQCAALPSVEFILSLTHIAEDDIVVEPFTVEKGGFYRLPQKPGLGITLDEKALRKYRIA
jgi:L-alanine-DL-glutamate epimerase-like enolase superfamily enzyme